jgi:hypothetical protein
MISDSRQTPAMVKNTCSSSRKKEDILLFMIQYVIPD